MEGTLLATTVAGAPVVDYHLQEALGLRSPAHLITRVQASLVSAAPLVRFQYPGAYGLLESGTDLVGAANDDRTSEQGTRPNCAPDPPRRRGSDSTAAEVAGHGTEGESPGVTAA